MGAGLAITISFCMCESNGHQLADRTASDFCQDREKPFHIAKAYFLLSSSKWFLSQLCVIVESGSADCQLVP